MCIDEAKQVASHHDDLRSLHRISDGQVTVRQRIDPYTYLWHRRGIKN